MPMGTYGFMKATVEKMEAQCMLGVRYATGMTLRKLAKMEFAMEWTAYY